VTVVFEQQLQRVAIVLIVVDDKDTGEFRCHTHLELFSVGSLFQRSTSVTWSMDEGAVIACITT
jgi:hypothetical protein